MRESKNQQYVIFDLDGTVVDTSHRYRNKPDGTIDLAYWFTHSTPENIMRDTLLPLASAMRNMYMAGYTVVVCTARSFEYNPAAPALADPGETYRAFLDHHGLFYDALLHRCILPDHESYSDGDLKIQLLSDYFKGEGFASPAEAGAIMFDDNRQVIAAMFSIGIKCYDAIEQNKFGPSRWAA